MFYAGLLFMIIGTIVVYGASYVTEVVKFRGENPLILKFVGLLLAVVGILMILYSEFPKRLNFIRII